VKAIERIGSAIKRVLAPESEKVRNWLEFVSSLSVRDAVSLDINLPDEGPKAGTVGTVIRVHNNGSSFDVEFENPRRVVTLAPQQLNPPSR